MIALFAALGLTAQPAPAPVQGPSLGLIFPTERLGKLSPPGCAGGLTKAEQTGRDTPTSMQKLADLPDAHMEIAVNRIDGGGCPVPMIVRYKVSR